MALTATLIAFASGIAAKVKTPPAWGPVTSPGDAMTLERLDRALAVQKNLTEHWQGEAKTFARRNVELELQLANARNERDALQAELHWATERQRGAQMAQQQALQAYQQQAYQQQAQGSQQLGLAQLGLAQNRLLGAQNLQLPAHWDCTCIPDRATALRQG
jgi:Skp family chaperone for outer membrane proteins